MSDHAIVHIEFPALDPKATAQFFDDLFGWKIQHAEEFNYYMWQPASGPGGGIVQVETTPEGGPLVYVGTDDIEATLARAESLGGKVATPKTEIPGNGWFAILLDPSGGRVALYTPMAG